MKSKTLVIGSLTVTSVVLGICAFYFGTQVIKSKNETQQSSAEIKIEAEVTEPEMTDVSEPTASETAATTTESEAITETTAVTTEELGPKPTISNTYLYYIGNNGAFQLYLHVSGSYASYSYQCYNKNPYDASADFEEYFHGESSKEEILIRDGLGETGISGYKALVTVWDEKQKQSEEQWAYVDESKSDDGMVHPPSNPVYLFGGNPANVKNSISLRTKPSAQAPVISEIPVGAQLGIYSCDVEGWYWTEYDGFQGYVNAKYVKEIESYDPHLYGGNITAIVDRAVSSITLYDSAPPNAAEIMQIPGGAEVRVYQMWEDCCFVCYNGQDGYVYSDFLIM